jgi:arylsulfatase A-like enzyme
VAAVCLLLVAHSGCGEGRSRPDSEGPNVLLITVDTLRADRLGCYGYGLETSPFIDRLAGRGVRFADCTVQWPKTWPSMASLHSGAYPKTIGVRHKHRVLDPKLLMMGEVFQAEGYRTAAVVANFNVGKLWGFDQGFDAFVESWQEGWAAEAGDKRFVNQPGKVKRYTNARIVTDQGLRWLREDDDDKPFFLWLHYMDPHGPYVPPAEYGELFQGAHPPEPVALGKLPRYQVQVEPGTRKPITDLAFYRAQYDREVRFLDDELERLFEELDRLGVERENTLVVLSADHGESFSEHGYYLEHGKFSYQACARVPLIVVQEGRLPAGRVVEEPVGLLDASATILDLAGIELPATFEGQSLVGVMDDREGASTPPYVFMQAGYKDLSQLTVRYGDWKLIAVPAPEDRALMTGGDYELYDVRADPDELVNLADQHPDLVARLSEILLGWFNGGPRWVEPGKDYDLDTLTPQEQEMLRGLGYIQ